jgi:hypothetical protein
MVYSALLCKFRGKCPLSRIRAQRTVAYQWTIPGFRRHVTIYIYKYIHVYDVSEALGFEVEGNCTCGEADAWLAPAYTSPLRPNIHVSTQFSDITDLSRFSVNNGQYTQ